MQKESKFAIFDYQEGDKNLTYELALYLDDNAEKVFDFFDVELPKDKVLIKIIPTKKEFNKIYKATWGVEVENWGIGFYHNILKEITYLSIYDYKNTSHAFKEEEFPQAKEYFKKTIVHEFVHYVNDLFLEKNKCGYTEKYLSEGLATLLSGQKDGEKLVFNNTMDEVLTGRGYYNSWYMLTKHLIENYDKLFVFELIKSNRKARKFLKSELFEKVTNCHNMKYCSKNSEVNK